MPPPSDETESAAPLKSAETQDYPWAGSMRRLRRQRFFRRLPWLLGAVALGAVVAWQLWPEGSPGLTSPAPKENSVEAVPVPGPPESPLELAVVALSSFQEEERAEAKEALIRMVETTPSSDWATAETALRALSRHKDLSQEEIGRIDAALSQLDPVQSSYRHLFWGQRLSQLPDENSRKRFSMNLLLRLDQIPENFRVGVVGTLRNEKLLRDITVKLPLEAALTDQQLYRVRIQQLIDERRWKEARAQLDASSPPVTNLEVEDLRDQVNKASANSTIVIP